MRKKQKRSFISSVKQTLPSQDSNTGRSLKTAAQTTIAAFVVFGSGLITAINGVPGCPDAVLNYLRDNIVQLAGSMGVSAGIVTFIWNSFRKDVTKYK